MSRRELDRLLDLLGKLSEQGWVEGRDRDAIATIRTMIHDRLDALTERSNES